LLALSAPSVTGMVKRLSEHGLLEHIPYRGVQLTEEGRRAVLLPMPAQGSPAAR
jgi:DtxR family Mn-dependent transcriptional regulator